MKQIKGEPWPPGETLAGNRDEIQMGDHGRIKRGSGDLLFYNKNNNNYKNFVNFIYVAL